MFEPSHTQLDLSALSVGLAPMEGVSDFSLRLWLSLTSAPPSMVTPFLRLTDTYPNLEKLPVPWCPEVLMPGIKDAVNYQTTVQVMSPEEDYVLRIADLMLKLTPWIDLNCGCPSPTVVGRGSGSSLLKDSEVFSQFVSKLSTKLGPHHLSIKMRTGYHDSHDFLTLIKSMEHLALKHLTIHGRTKAERYLGKANWQAISEAANVLSFPVIGSGDICDLETFANRIPHHSKISGVIIGRGALRNPWVFTEILTGQKVSISLSTLHWSLSSYALICHMFRYDFDRLIDLVLSGAFKHCLGTSSDKWQTFYQTLSQHLFGGTVAPEDLELSVPTLGRIKMLWHYLRSSLPEPFFRPTCLRSKSLGEFLNHLGKAGLDAERCDFTLCWYPEKDWVYAGKGAAS